MPFDFRAGRATWTPAPSVSVAGMPKTRALTPAYEGAVYGRRTAGWQPGNDSVNTALFYAGDTLRARSRDLIRKNAWAYAASDEYVSEAIGDGIVPRSKHPDPVVAAKLQKLWLDWTDNADSAGLLDFYGLQALVVRSVIEGGDAIFRCRPRRESDGLVVPLQIQVLESEHLPLTLNQVASNNNIVRGGVEFDGIGRRVAFWLYPRHPGEFDALSVAANSLSPVRVPALGMPSWSSGAGLVFKPIRPGQVRGEPWLSRALIKLNEIDQYTDAEVVRKKTAAMFAAFITENSPDDSLPGGANGSELDTPLELPPAGVEIGGLEPGMMQKLRPGESITFSTPADVGGGFDPFMRATLREVAKAMGVTYEQLSGDLTGVNYSSIRAGLLAFRRRCAQFQNHIVIFQFCRPIWTAFIEAAVIGGEINARDFNRNRSDYLRVKWVTPGWAWVDPLKDLEAAKGMVRSGFASRSQVVAGQGYDSEEIDAENQNDNARADEKKLVYDSDPRQTSNTGMRPDPHNDANPDGLANDGTQSAA